jgi:hypothetical protein
MDRLDPQTERCLTDDERTELTAGWKTLQSALEVVGSQVAGADPIDCDQLHESFLQLSDAYEGVEHLVMRAKQWRFLHAAHTGNDT